MIKSFSEEFSFLSNFFQCPVRWCGIEFATAEHAYQASKTLDVHERMSIALLDTPGKAKRAGRKLTIRPDWEEIKVDLMAHIVGVKFETNLALMAKLVATGFHLLIEGNKWHDNFWGACLCFTCRGITGENHLGKILMQIRDDHTGQ